KGITRCLEPILHGLMDECDAYLDEMETKYSLTPAQIPDAQLRDRLELDEASFQQLYDDQMIGEGDNLPESEPLALTELTAYSLEANYSPLQEEKEIEEELDLLEYEVGY